MDVGRYLAGEAILARPPSAGYKLQKLISRHKLKVAAFGIVLTTLIAGLSITTWSLTREKRARRDAEAAHEEADRQRQKAESGERTAITEAARSQQVTEFLKQMLVGVDPMVARGRDTTMLREI